MADNVRVYQGGEVMCNGYLIEAEDGFIAIDAPAGMVDWILSRRPDAKISHLLITHMHFDHVQDAARMKEQFGCTIHAHSPYNDDLTLVHMASQEWGMQLHLPAFEVDEAFGDAKHTADWGGKSWFIHFVPGHSADGIAYHLPDEEVMFVGDILFAGSVGRTDFPGGSLKQLQQGIHERLLNQEAQTRIYPGHGPYTSVKDELLSNPYLS